MIAEILKFAVSNFYTLIVFLLNFNHYLQKITPFFVILYFLIKALLL